MRSGRGCSVGARNTDGRSRGERRTTPSGSWSRRSSFSVRAGRPWPRCTTGSSLVGRRPKSCRERASTRSHRSIRPLGLVRRAATLKSLAMAIVEHGCVPGSMDELLSLPGVGRYAASATLAVAFEKHAPVVDGVTARVYRRFFGMESSVPAVSDGHSGSWWRRLPPGSASGSGTGRCWIWPLRCVFRRSPGARSVPCGRAAPGNCRTTISAAPC